MMARWPTARVDQIADKVGMGPFGSSIKVETFVPVGVPVISGQHLRGSKVDDSSGFNFISPEHAERLKSANVQRGDVVFTHAGNIGQVAYVPATSLYDRYVISQRQFYLRCNPAKVMPEFVVAFFKTHEGRHKLLANASQTGVPSIAQPVSYLRTIEIPLPPLSEQRAIVSILGSLDDRIDINRNESETLEAMARALFKSWFVDFDPVHAKAEGRDAGLPPEIAALFPGSLEDSEAGEIPSGWKQGSIVDVAVLNPEAWSKNTRPDVIKYVDLTGVRWGVFKPPQVYEQAKAPSRAQRVLRTGDTLVGTVRPANGAYGLVMESGLTGSTGFAVLRSGKARALTYLAATSKSNIERLGHFADGGAYPAVRPEMVAETRIPLPPDKLLCAFEAIASPLLDRFAKAEQESGTLVALRDALLPRLISGELRTAIGDP